MIENQGTQATINVVPSGEQMAQQNQSAPTNTNQQVDWTTGLDDGKRGYVQTKGFKDVGSIVDSYQNLEKLMGAPKERLLKLPEKSDAPEWNEIYDRMGRPKTANDYKFATPANSDEGFVNWAKETFHKNGLTQKQAETLINGYNELNKSRETEYTNQVSRQHENDLKALKSEWGAAYEQNANIVDQAAVKFGLDSEVIQGLKEAMGPAGAMKFLHNIGSKIGEASFVGSNSPEGFSGALTPQQASYKIQEMMKDSEFKRRLMSGDTEAKSTWEKLHRMKVGEV